MEKHTKQVVGDLIFGELKITTALTIARHLNITSKQAHEILKQFHDLHKGSLLAIYTVSGQMVRAGITCGAVVLSKDVNLEETKSHFTSIEGVQLFALHKDPIDDLALTFAYDAVEDEKFFRDDTERATIRSLQVRKFREKMEAEHKEQGSGQRPGISNFNKISPKAELKNEMGNKNAEQKSKISVMFQKACDREKTPKSTPKKIRESPFSSLEKKNPDTSPNPKRRARKILLDSEEELSPKKKQKTTAAKEERDTNDDKNTSQKNRGTMKPTEESVTKPFKNDDDTYQAESSRESSPVKEAPQANKPQEKKKKRSEKENQNILVRRSPRKLAPTSVSGKRTVMRKEVATFKDEDGFLVTKEVLREVEVEEDCNNVSADVKPSKMKEPVISTSKKAQTKISSFFTKK